MRLLLKNGHLLDPASRKDGRFDVLVEDGKIAKVQMQITDRADSILDVTDCYVMPGLIDLNVHLREPGFIKKETIVTGGRAAVKGGFTTVCTMPDNRPVTDSSFIVSDIIRQASRESLANVMPVGSMTLGGQGMQVADLEGMMREGAVGFSEGSRSVVNADVCRKAMLKAADLKMPVLDFCEDPDLSSGGVMNAGEQARKLGLKGIPESAEDVMTARDIFLARETGCQLHVLNCSTTGSLMMIWMAKQQGLPVTASTSPEYFTLTEKDVKPEDSSFKLNPPLRDETAKNAVIQALKSDLIDVISSGHCPHEPEEKEKSMAEAPFGYSSLETALQITYTSLVRTGILSPMKMVEKMSSCPAAILGINRGTLEPGSFADITVFDPRYEYTIERNNFVSLCKSTPFQGRKVHGRVKATIVNGQIVYYCK